MSILLGLAVGFLLLFSLFFNTMGIVGLYRFPDVYSRIHAVAKCTTFGTLFAIFALFVYGSTRFLIEGEPRFMAFSIRVLIAIAIFLSTNPAGIHALARAIHNSGQMPVTSMVDALEEKKKEMKKREGGATA